MQTSMELIATFSKTKGTTLILSRNNSLPCTQHLAMLLISVAPLQRLSMFLINVDKIISSNPEKISRLNNSNEGLIPENKGEI